MTSNNIVHRKSDAPYILLRAVGDVNFSRSIGKCLHGQSGYNPLPRITDLLGEVQLSLFNLECNPVSDEKRFWSMSEMIAPASFLDQLRKEFNIANVANNHIMDPGVEAFLDTMEQLKARQFVAVGGGRNTEEADSLRIVDENGIRIGITACTDFTYTPHREGNRALKNKPGVSIFEPKKVISRINRNKQLVDVLICSIHTGLEFHSYPDPRLIRDAHAMVDAGANIILVHHAHVRQGIEMYNDGLIAYGLGNFIFDIDHPHIQQEDAPTDIGLVLDIFIDKLGVTGYNFWLSKIHSDNRTTILTEIENNIDIYQEQLVLNSNLSNEILIKQEWKKVCIKYFKDRCYSLYWALRKRNFSRFYRLAVDLKRRENLRWIAGLFGR